MQSVAIDPQDRDQTRDQAGTEWPDLDGAAFEGREVHIRHLTGFDPARNGVSGPLAEQCRQALANGAQSLAAEGLSMGDVTRVVYLLREADGFSACFPLLRDAFGDARPGATMRLIERFETPEIDIELELIARARPTA
jgi:2-iminobutanoate/2-iminopropanoate deaminase